MQLNEYQKEAMVTGQHPSNEPRLDLMAAGLAGEAGEVNDFFKKHYFHGHPLDREKLKKELGDVLWYVAFGADAIGAKLDEIGVRADAMRLLWAGAGENEAATVSRAIKMLAFAAGNANYRVLCAQRFHIEAANAGIAEDLARVMFHVQEIAETFAFSIDEIMVANVAKCRARYPNGFSQADSINRKPEAG